MADDDAGGVAGGGKILETGARILLDRARAIEWFHYAHVLPARAGHQQLHLALFNEVLLLWRYRKRRSGRGTAGEHGPFRPPIPDLRRDRRPFSPSGPVTLPNTRR